MPSPLSAKKFVASLIVGWVVLLNVQALILNRFNFPLKIVFGDSFLSASFLLLAGLLILNIVKYYLPNSSQLVGVLASSLVLSLLWLLITNSFLKIIFEGQTVYLDFLHNSLLIRFAFAFLVLAIVTTASILWYNWEERQKEFKRQSDVEALSREAELFKLRQQLQPHFLFNSLNSINALIALDPQQARKMVQQLSDFLRGTLKKDESQMITLKEEVGHLNLYLEIEKVRFGNRLQTEIIMEDGCEEMLLPALLLQPVVENAIKFGLYDTTGATLIKINCSRLPNELCIMVSNPHDPETSMPMRGTGFGLSSISRRLYLLYARNDLLNTEKTEKIYKTFLKIPQTI